MNKTGIQLTQPWVCTLPVLTKILLFLHLTLSLFCQIIGLLHSNSYFVISTFTILFLLLYCLHSWHHTLLSGVYLSSFFLIRYTAAVASFVIIVIFSNIISTSNICGVSYIISRYISLNDAKKYYIIEKFGESNLRGLKFFYSKTNFKLTFTKYTTTNSRLSFENVYKTICKILFYPKGGTLTDKVKVFTTILLGQENGEAILLWWVWRPGMR